MVGDNGSGKTTILQAVALCLSMVSWRIRAVEEFQWLGSSLVVTCVIPCDSRFDAGSWLFDPVQPAAIMGINSEYNGRSPV
ncbi:MAG: hypothetical protein ACNY01_04480 [Desulfobacteria bacterium]